MLEEKGWRVRHAYQVAGRPPRIITATIQDSYGEFSACKPSSIKFSLAWMSDRTLCYLASGKPAVVEYTGPSAFLPDAGASGGSRPSTTRRGRSRRSPPTTRTNAASARALAEEVFDARRVAGRVLEIVGGK